MATKYWYLDDNEGDTTKGFISNLKQGNSNLEITHNEPNWNTLIEDIKENVKEYDGLLLDLKLYEEKPNDRPTTMRFYAPAIAEEIRTLVKRGTIKKDLPILLCSTEGNIKKMYDSTAKDLFDDCFDKTKIKDNDANKFIVHSEAYKKLHQTPDDLPNALYELLKASSDNHRILVEVKKYFNSYTTIHEKASFLLNQVVKPTGFFIDEDVLAIRLGIDKDKSVETWKTLKTLLEPYTYEGIYANLQKRWWMRDINKWWNDNFPAAKALTLLTATQRVNYINTLSKLVDLQQTATALDNPNEHKSTKYWYQCKLSKRPLDSIDGLRYLPKSQFTWQNTEFVAISFLNEASLDTLKSLKNKLIPYGDKKLSTIIQNLID